VVQEHVIEEIATEVVQPTPTSPSPSSLVIPSTPPHQSPSPPLPQAAEGSSHLVQQDEENVFNQGRISVDMETNEGIELVVDQEKDAEVEGRQADTQAKIYNIDLDHSSKVATASVPIPAAKPKVLKIAVAPAVSIRKRKGVKAAKRRKLNEEAQEANDLRGRLEIFQDEDDDVFVEAIPLAQKVPVVDYQVVVIHNKPRYKIIRADDTHQLYISFTTLLKNFDREDLETLWRIVKDRFSTKKPTNFSDEYLLLTLKTMFRELDE
nr:hypothetical protein [Tanacetum cinerariifolium]